MDQIFQGLRYCFLYVDDVLISSPDIVSHLEHVRSVLDLLLSINPDKCIFAAPEVDYLSMRVSGSGCFPLVKNTDIISPFPCPSDKKGLQRFLGVLNFFTRFIKGASDLLHPLTEALKGKPLTLIWNLEMNQFFAAAKSVLANVPTHVHPDPSAQISLSVDASSSHVGAVL